MIDLLKQAQILHTINRTWKGVLSSSQYSILMSVYDRTISWGKMSERISTKELTEGCDTEGASYRCGLDMCKSQVKLHLRYLVSEGFIIRSGPYNYPIYTINIDKKGVVNMPKSNLKIPKKPQNRGRKTDLWGSENRPMGVGKPTSIRKELNKKRTSQKEIAELPPSSSFDEYLEGEEKSEVGDIIESIVERDQDRINREYVAGAKKKRPTIADLEAGWKKGFLDAFGDTTIYAKWVKMERKHMLNWFRGTELPPHLSPVTYLEWVARNWLWVCEQDFGWMGKKRGYNTAPLAPTVKFFLYAKLSFSDWYKKRGEFEGKRLEFAMKLKGQDLREQGYTEEEISAIHSPKPAAKQKQKKVTARANLSRGTSPSHRDWAKGKSDKRAADKAVLQERIKNAIVDTGNLPTFE